MVARIKDIPEPELFIGFVSPIGADVQSCVEDFRHVLCSLGYRVVDIKVTDIFTSVKDFIPAKEELKTTPSHDRYQSHINYGNQLRDEFSDDAFLAAITIGRISRARADLVESDASRFRATAYLVHQFKRREEIDLFRSVYGRLFFQVSVYSRRGARVDHLAHTFANSENSANINKYRSLSEDIIQKDENENSSHGQKVSKIFHDGDLIVNTDIERPSRRQQVERFCNLLFGHNGLSPTKMEYGMFLAKAAALRTLDLSRQVGAAIFSAEGEVVSIGSNEVPKGGGGTYWSDEDFDGREFTRNVDSNDRRKREILSEIAELLDKEVIQVLADPKILDSQFMDALEYGRIIHAEMSAITDAARLGRKLKDSVLYCTTFPCHMCAKHVVSSGLKRVVFLEPYPKSLVLDLHSDSISVESGDRGRYSSYPSVSFEHFFGISPRRYREMFERAKRKDSSGHFQTWEHGYPRPNLGVTDPYYQQTEYTVIKEYVSEYMRNKSMTDIIYALDKIGIYAAAPIGQAIKADIPVVAVKNVSDAAATVSGVSGEQV